MGDHQAPGTLFVVATPIGNMGDISARALALLADVDVIAAEDTRHTSVLLRHYGINTPMVSLHEHNEARRSAELVARLRQGESVALVSDAGTPLVSDPGYRLVRDAVRGGLPVSPVPGPSALLAALSVAGLPTDRFTFEGFLPASRGSRRRALQRLRDEERTMVFYESPHRIADSLSDLSAAFGESREAGLCRELTKRFETVCSADLGRLCRLVAEDDNQRRGEFVIVVAGAEQSDDGVRAEWVDAVRRLAAWMPLKQASREVAELTGAGSQALYRAARRSGSE